MRNRSLVLVATLALAPAAPAAGQIADRVGVSGRARIAVGPVTVRVGVDDTRGWRTDRCYDARGVRRAGTHDWYDAWNRDVCDPRYDRVVVVPRRGLAFEHAQLQDRLAYEHERWHRSHGWYPRNRGWVRSHERLHARLDREHERWHRSRGAAWNLYGDAGWRADVPGRGRGVARR